jgi:hypothetical protein
MRTARFAISGLLVTSIALMFCYFDRLLYLRQVAIDGWSDQITFYEKLHEQTILLLGGSVGLVLLAAIAARLSVSSKWDQLKVWIMIGAVLIGILAMWAIMPIRVFFDDAVRLAVNLRLREWSLRVVIPVCAFAFSVLLSISICVQLFRQHRIEPS